MEIKLDDLNFQEVFNAAIIKTLDEKKKDELIKGAISYLMSEGDSTYGNDKTPLQHAFEDALQQKAREYIADFIDKDPTVKEAIIGLIKDAVVKITTDNRDKTVGNIADKIIEGLYNDRY